MQRRTFLGATIATAATLAAPMLKAQALPTGPVHARARGMRMEIDHPVEGKVPNIGFAVKLSGTPQQMRRHPPLLGEHTEELLAELGIGAGERTELEAQGAFAA